MIQLQLVIALLADPDVVDIIGTRLYPMRIPQNGSLPAAVYQRISAVPVTSMDGDSGLDDIRIQISCWAATYAQAVDLASKIRTAINSSSLKSRTNGIIDNEDPETKNYGVIQDFSMWIASDPGTVASVARFRHVTFTGTCASAVVSLPSSIAENGFYLITKNGRICQETEEFTINDDRDEITFAEDLAGGGYPDEGLIIYQEQIMPSFVEDDFELVQPTFERVEFEGDGVTTEFDLPSAIVTNGFYLVTINGRIAKEGTGNTYTINTDRNKIIFNSALAGGDFKDEGIIIYQKT